LTNSQRVVFNELRRFFDSGHRILNVYGREGVGKTFLAWLLANQQAAEYAGCVDELPRAVARAVLDNSSSDRTFVRGMRNVMGRQSIDQLILLSRSRVEDAIPAFELVLDEDDIRCVRANLFRMDVELPDKPVRNLWELLALVAEEEP